MIKLTEQELKIVKTILKKHVPAFEVYVFGSRNNGNPHNYSDLDLAIIGPSKIDLLKIANIRDDFQSSALPFRVDVIDFNRVSPEFQNIILKNGEQLY